MLPRWFRPMSLASVAAVVGCGWVDTRSDFERDPFVMSHLTHQKNDPMYAGSESDHSFEEKEPFQAASVSRKQRAASAARNDFQQLSYKQDSSSLTRADDFSWVEGRLKHGTGKEGGWVLHYAAVEGDPHRGELALVDSPRLGLAREGDRVRVEGKLLGSDVGTQHYQVDSIVVLSP